MSEPASPDDPASPPPAFLDAKEVEGLLAPTPTEEPAKPFQATAEETSAGRKVIPYDFRNPAFLSESELRRLRALQEEFARFLSARLSLSLRMDLGLTLAGVSTLPFQKFTETLPNPTHISLFKIEPLSGVGILDIDVRLALALADRLLGGRGTFTRAARPLTEIETALIEDVILVILEEWCGQWKAEPVLRPAIIGHETSGRFLQTSASDAVMLALVLECTFGDCAARIQLGVPYAMIEPVAKKMQAQRQKETTTAPAAKRVEWQTSYDRIVVPMRAEWQAFELTLREITSLRVGDVIEMQPDVCANTRVLLNGTPKFIGTVGLDADRVAVQLTRKIPSEDSSHG